VEGRSDARREDADGRGGWVPMHHAELTIGVAAGCPAPLAGEGDGTNRSGPTTVSNGTRGGQPPPTPAPTRVQVRGSGERVGAGGRVRSASCTPPPPPSPAARARTCGPVGIVGVVRDSVVDLLTRHRDRQRAATERVCCAAV